MSSPKSIVRVAHSRFTYNHEKNGISNCVSGKSKSPISSGTSSAETNTSKCDGLLNSSAKRIYSSMRITKKEMPYLRATNIKNISATSIWSNRDPDNLDERKSVTNFNNKNQTHSNDIKNSMILRQKQTLACTNKSLSSNSKNTRNISNKLKPSSLFINENNTKQAFSTEFPNGLPFEDEFYHKKREKSMSSKSELSDYGSIENDSDHSHSLLPFEEEFACRRPSLEALYVDFSKPIARKTTNSSYSKSIINGFSSGSCSSSSSSSGVIINKADNYDYLSKDYMYNPDEVVVRNQPLVYVAVQWRSNQNGITDQKPHRFDAV